MQNYGFQFIVLLGCSFIFGILYFSVLWIIYLLTHHIKKYLRHRKYDPQQWEPFANENFEHFMQRLDNDIDWNQHV